MWTSRADSRFHLGTWARLTPYLNIDKPGYYSECSSVASQMAASIWKHYWRCYGFPKFRTRCIYRFGNLFIQCALSQRLSPNTLNGIETVSGCEKDPWTPSTLTWPASSSMDLPRRRSHRTSGSSIQMFNNTLLRRGFGLESSGARPDLIGPN